MDCILKTELLLDCAPIRVCVVIRGNTVCRKLRKLFIWKPHLSGAKHDNSYGEVLQILFVQTTVSDKATILVIIFGLIVYNQAILYTNAKISLR